jgi:DNA replication protein DnaC
MVWFPSLGFTQGPVRVEQLVTLEEFDFTASSKPPAAQIRDRGALRRLHAGESVILFGPVGVGKTHIAQALGHLAGRQGAHVRFAKTSRILADLTGGHADRTCEKWIRELVRPTRCPHPRRLCPAPALRGPGGRPP